MSMFELPKRRRLFYNEEDDLHLLREVAGQNPFNNQERWPKIRENVIEATGKAFTLRSLKERVTLLAEKFAAKAVTDKYKSGIEEEVTEVDDLLHAIVLLINDFKNKPKTESKSHYQKGFDKRELAQNAIESSSTTENALAINDTNNEDNHENQMEYIIVSEGDLLPPNPDSKYIISNTVQEEADVENIRKTGSDKVTGRNVKAGGNKYLCSFWSFAKYRVYTTPARVRPGGLKQTSIRYLEKKNDRWFEVRSRELALAEKKWEFECMERQRRLEMDQARLKMEEKRLEIQLDIFQNQQRLMEIAFQTRSQQL